MNFKISEVFRFAVIENLNYAIVIATLFVQGFYLEPSAIGAFYISTLPSFLLLALVSQSLNLTILRGECEATSPALSENIQLYTTYLFVLFLVLLINQYVTNSHLSIIVVSCILLHSFFEINSLIYEANLQLRGRYEMVPKIRAIASFLSLSTLLVLFFQGQGIIALYLFLLFGGGFKYFCHRLVSREVSGKVNLTLLLSHLRNHASYSFLNFSARNIDQYLFSFILGLGAVGVYNRSIQIIQIPIKVLNGLIAGLFLPKAIVNKVGSVVHELQSHVSVLIIISCGFAIFFQYFLGDMLKILWGSEWDQVSRSIIYLAPAIIIQAIIGYKTSLAVMGDLDSILFRVGLINLTTVFPVPVFAALYGFDEALFAYSFSYAVIGYPLYEILVSRLVLNQSYQRSLWNISEVSVPIILILVGIEHYPNLAFVGLSGWFILLLMPFYRLFGNIRNVIKS